MGHLTLELILWMALMFSIGCIAGYFVRHLRESRSIAGLPAATAGSEITAEEEGETAAEASSDDSSHADAAEDEDAAEDTNPEPGEPVRPRGLAVPRDGNPDNLQKISGIGQKLERTLNGLGFYHFDQIAGWSGEEVRWVDSHLKVSGRIERDRWIEQAGLLSRNEIDTFNERFGPGKKSAKTPVAEKTG